jgi:hypothetical protein
LFLFFLSCLLLFLSCLAYAAGDSSNLMLSMAVPAVLGDTKMLFPDLLDEDEAPESFLPTAQLAEGQEGALEQHNRTLQKQVEELQAQVSRWSSVNNDLYQFCMTQLLAAPADGATPSMPKKQRRYKKNH